MPIRSVPSSQLHHLVQSGDPIHIEHGESPRKRFAVLWPLSVRLEDQAGNVVGDHYMYDGHSWLVGTRDELTKAHAEG